MVPRLRPPQRLIVLLLLLAVIGCFYSDQRLATASNTAQPLPDETALTMWHLAKGEWKKGPRSLVRKDGFGYRASSKGSRDTTFSLIALGGPYYAIEQPGTLRYEGKWTYGFLEVKADEISRWNVDADKGFMTSLVSNPALQRELAISCSEAGVNGECKVASVATLGKIFEHIRGQKLAPAMVYRPDRTMRLNDVSGAKIASEDEPKD